jgi:hypothetical protein
VAKVGITENPAERLYDIFKAFENLGEPQPLLTSLSRDDDPQTAVAKAKLIDKIIFIEKVHTPGTAEKDIRTILQIGQPNLPQDFFPLFAAQVPKEKKGYLDVVGKTEWIMMKNGLVSILQQKFRGGGIYESSRRRFLGGVRTIPSGVELTCAVTNERHQFASSRGPTLAMASGCPSPLVITFKATNFKYNFEAN